MVTNSQVCTNIELIVDNDYIRRSTDLIRSAKSEIILSTFKIQTGRNNDYENDDFNYPLFIKHNV